jgi:catechol-2,3-dioxygenase
MCYGLRWRCDQFIIFFMKTSPYGFLRIKVMALPVLDLNRANKFYGDTLGLPSAYEGSEQVGYLMGETILMLKAEW